MNQEHYKINQFGNVAVDTKGRQIKYISWDAVVMGSMKDLKQHLKEIQDALNFIEQFLDETKTYVTCNPKLGKWLKGVRDK